jgi:PEP-CTERM/exosortase A-associated glycosyltransferase
MRILHVLDHSLPLHSGYAFRSAAILREQQRLGWMTAQVTGPKHECAESEQVIDGQRYLRTPYTVPGIAGIPVLNQADVVFALRRRLAAIARDFRPDIIHAHSPCLNGLAAMAVARRLGIPFAYELRASWEDAAVSHGTTREGGIKYRLSRALETRVITSADAVTTICEGLRRDILERGVAAECVTVIANAVDAGHFSRALPADMLLKARMCRPDATVIGFLGSFYAYEGLDVLLQAVPGLLARVPGLHVLLVGGGPEEANLRRQSVKLGISHAVTFVGRVPQREIPSYYAITDLLLYPRRGNRLTEMVTPLKPLEAMAQYRVVAASDVGGHRELIRHGETGFLFPPDDPEAVVAAVVDILRNPGLEAVRLAALRYVEAERTWSRVVAGYRAVYQSLVSGVPAALPADKGRP